MNDIYLEKSQNDNFAVFDECLCCFNRIYVLGCWPSFLLQPRYEVFCHSSSGEIHRFLVRTTKELYGRVTRDCILLGQFRFDGCIDLGKADFRSFFFQQFCGPGVFGSQRLAMSTPWCNCVTGTESFSRA